MKDVELDPVTWSPRIVAGDFVIIEGLAALRQAVMVRLKNVRGENFLDPDDGISYFRSTDPLVLEAEIKEAITTTPGVRSLTAFTAKVSGRTLKVKFSADTDLGTITVDELT